jgi:hypothetical protein
MLALVPRDGKQGSRGAHRRPWRMNPDLPVRWIFVKAGLFVLLALLALAILVLQQPTWTTAGCALALGWASARAYYFAFHVVQHWVDPEFRFRGLGHFFTWIWQRRSRC